MCSIVEQTCLIKVKKRYLMEMVAHALDDDGVVRCVQIFADDDDDDVLWIEIKDKTERRNS